MSVPLPSMHRDELLAKWQHVLIEVSKANLWDLPQEIAWLCEYCQGRLHILELGAYNGASTKAMLLANPDLKIHVVDTWDDAGTHENFLGLLAGEIHDGRLTFYHGSTEAFFKSGPDMRFDGCFIDAGHSKENVVCDIVGATSLMNPGTWICGHDYHAEWPDNGVSQAVRELCPGHVIVMESIWAWRTDFHNAEVSHSRPTETP